MQPVDMERVGGSDGDCLMACLASILGADLAAMPEITDELSRSGEWWAVVEGVAERYGWQAEAMQHDGDHVPGGFAIAFGPVARCEEGHAVVMLDGAMVHDPHPSRAGLTAIEGWITLTRVPHYSGE